MSLAYFPFGLRAWLSYYLFFSLFSGKDPFVLKHKKRPVINLLYRQLGEVGKQQKKVIIFSCLFAQSHSVGR